MFVLVLGGTLTIAPDLARAQSEEDRPVSIAQLMTPEEVGATGLRELAPEQLQALSAWLDGYRIAIERRAVMAADEDYSPPELVIETRIDGDFDGWVGDTVFRLENGQIWQQISPSAKYHTAHQPKVTITRSPYLMRVEGVPIEIEVRRLK